MADGMRFANRAFDGSGTAINLATVNLYDVGTTTPVRATTTTNATGDWEIDHATRGMFDIEIVNGTTTRRNVQDVEAQLKSLWLWNADANEYALGVTRTEDVASAEVAYFEGDRATMADGDLAYISLRLSDSAGNQDEQARIEWVATTVANGATQDGDLVLYALVNNTLTEFVRLDGSAAEIAFPSGTVLNFASGDVTITHSTNVLTIAGVATRVDLAAGILEMNNAVEWDTGVAVVATEYSIGRDADATNQLHFNVPTGATYEWSTNDVSQMVFGAGILYLGDTANAQMTTGITLNQAGAANQILAFKSSDVTHGFTTPVEADTYGYFAKAVAASGGIDIEGWTSATRGIFIQGNGTTDNTTKSTAASGHIVVQASTLSGSSQTTPGADANMVVFTEGGTGNARFIFDVEGTGHADVAWTTYDTYDDLALVRDMESELLAREDSAQTDRRHALEAAGIIGRDSWHFKDGKLFAMVNLTKLQMLHHGALIQIGERLNEIAALRAEVADLRKMLPAA